jgi:hypothetical protein
MNRTVRSLDTIMLGDCIGLMNRLDAASIDFVLTDPPYITNYRDRSGRTVANDDNDRWLDPAFAEIFRLLKDDSYCVSFYGWNQADRFIAAWRQAVSTGRPYRLQQMLRLLGALHALPPRASLPSGQGRSLASSSTDSWTFCHFAIAAIGCIRRRSPSRL